MWTSARRSTVWMMTSMFSRRSRVMLRSERLPSSVSRRRSSGWKITSTAMVDTAKKARSSQFNTSSLSAVVSTVSASRKNMPATAGAARVVRRKL